MLCSERGGTPVSDSGPLVSAAVVRVRYFFFSRCLLHLLHGRRAWHAVLS